MGLYKCNLHKCILLYVAESSATDYTNRSVPLYILKLYIKVFLIVHLFFQVICDFTKQLCKLIN